LARLNERAPDVPIFDEPLLQGEPGLGGVADSGRDRGVWHRDHQIRLDRMLAGEDLAHLLTNGVDQLAVDHTVWPREVDVLEGAGRPLREAGHGQRDWRAEPL